jgi:biopolymer transport protein ExbD
MPVSLPNVRRKARIEIIPLIDIVFFLLATFVMVSMSMIKNLGVPVRLPDAVTGVAEDRKAAITLTATKEGDVYLDKEKIPLDQVRSKLKSLKANDPNLKVFINGDQEADFGHAVELLDEVRAVGITKISIQTKSKK